MEVKKIPPPKPQEIAAIVTTAVPLASLISLIPGCLSRFLRFLLQQLIQRF
jgi:hypothetical protein